MSYILFLTAILKVDYIYIFEKCLTVDSVGWSIANLQWLGIIRSFSLGWRSVSNQRRFLYQTTSTSWESKMKCYLDLNVSWGDNHYILLGNGPNGVCRSLARWADSAFECRRKGCGTFDCPILVPFEPEIRYCWLEIKEKQVQEITRQLYQTIRWTCSSFEPLVRLVRYWHSKENPGRPINRPSDYWHYHCERVSPGDSCGPA